MITRVDLRLAGTVLVLVLSVVTADNDMVIQCTTPTGTFGSCIYLDSCRSLTELAISGGFDLVRKSHCGFNGTKPKVCCPNGVKMVGENSQTINFPKDTDNAPANSRQTTEFPTTLPPRTVPPIRPQPGNNRLPAAQTRPPPVRTTPFYPTPPPPRVPQPRPTPSPSIDSQAQGQHISGNGKEGREPSLSTAWKEEVVPLPEFSSTKIQDNRFTTTPGNEVFIPLIPDPSIQGETQQAVLPGNVLPDLSFCGSVSIVNKIYGGDNNTGIEEFPWMALLKYRVGSGEQYGCAGALINNRYVLTAAHCVRTANEYQLMQVRLGEWNLETEVDCQSETECNAPPVDMDVEEVVVHPGFDRVNLTNDVALIRLAHPVQYSPWIQPICLPPARDRDFTEELFTVAGWGQTESGGHSPVLLKLEVRHVDLEICSVAYEKLSIMLGPGNLCAGGLQGRDTCAGDSGGPLMNKVEYQHETNYYAVGVVSLGPSRCGLEGWAGVYTKVSYYVNWVKSSLRP